MSSAHQGTSKVRIACCSQKFHTWAYSCPCAHMHENVRCAAQCIRMLRLTPLSRIHVSDIRSVLSAASSRRGGREIGGPLGLFACVRLCVRDARRGALAGRLWTSWPPTWCAVPVVEAAWPAARCREAVLTHPKIPRENRTLDVPCDPFVSRSPTCWANDAMRFCDTLAYPPASSAIPEHRHFRQTQHCT